MLFFHGLFQYFFFAFCLEVPIFALLKLQF